VIVCVQLALARLHVVTHAQATRQATAHAVILACCRLVVLRGLTDLVAAAALGGWVGVAA
jgi:hypothetical protein